MKQFIIILFILFVSVTYSQKVKFEAIVPSVVSASERFYLKYTINQTASDFRSPDLSDFKVLSGPNQSHSSNMSFVNGNMTKETTITLTYVLLAKKVGKFTIKPTTIKVKGKTYNSNSIKIEVVGKGQKPKKNTTSGTNNSSDINDKSIYVKVLVNKRNVYKGEQLIATVKLFTKYDIAGFEDIKFPSWNGFYTQEIPTSDQVTLNRENVNGEIYYTAVLQKMILQPQQTGSITIEPADFNIIILKKSRRRSFFDSGYKRFKASVKSKPVKINVKNLPKAPEGYNGTVGSFKFSAKIDKYNVKVNDAISLKINIWGNGNLKLIGEPEINLPPDFELFDDAQITDKIKNTSIGASGSRAFEYIFSPRHSGNYRIPPIKFVYFDPKLKKYKTLTSDEFNIKVERSDGDTTHHTNIVRGTTKEDIQYLGKDIRFIKTGKLILKEKSNYLYGSNLFLTVYLFSLLLFIILFIVKRKHIKDSADTVLMRNKKANKAAKKHLKSASISLKENNKNKFYDDVAKALWGYIADKLSLSGAELNKDNIETTLLKHKVENDLVAEFIELLNTCEFERYAPSSKEDRLTEVFESAETLIGKFERKIKKVKS